MADDNLGLTRLPEPIRMEITECDSLQIATGNTMGDGSNDRVIVVCHYNGIALCHSLISRLATRNVIASLMEAMDMVYPQE